jgi:hypothetical protein
MELLQQARRIASKAMDVVGRHERHDADMERSAARGRDLDAALVGITSTVNFKGQLV